MTTITSAAAASAQSNAARTSLTNNFETFLTLLTAQLRNQDPLSPTDANEFTNQLVQFSGVEQQLRTNDLLEQMVVGNQLSGGATAVAYLGKEAVADTNVAGLATVGNASWTYTLPRAATSVSLRVLDTQGRTIATADGTPGTGAQTFTWDGRNLSGGRAAAGTYQLVAQATGADGRTFAVPVSQRGLITGVDMSGAQPTVTLAGASVPLSAIRSIALANN